ncbi:MAG: acyl-CoA thioesterase [Bacteroidales bacterium]|nr:acyl-CoA thioesterase [Bacteroidales bacterium]
MFSCPIQIRMSDLDPFDHVNNGAQCNLFDYGRSQYFENHFKKEINWLTFDFVLVHVELDFKKPVKIHDKIVCETEAYEVGHTSFKMRQYLKNAVTDEILTVCHSVIVCIDREKNIPKEISDDQKLMFGFNS